MIRATKDPSAGRNTPENKVLRDLSALPTRPRDPDAHLQLRLRAILFVHVFDHAHSSSELQEFINRMTRFFSVSIFAYRFPWGKASCIGHDIARTSRNAINSRILPRARSCHATLGSSGTRRLELNLCFTGRVVGGWWFLFTSRWSGGMVERECFVSRPAAARRVCSLYPWTFPAWCIWCISPLIPVSL